MVVEGDEHPKKSLGQHWLSDNSILESITEMADITNTDNILEIGPGLGTLTAVLLKKAHKVVAIEFDSLLAVRLKERLRDEPKLEVINEDIRRFDLTNLPPDYKVVANIPYYLTSYLVRLLSITKNPPLTAVLLIQQEVAERLAAKPGELSLLGVTAQSYWDVELGLVVPPEMFTPPPKVNSQVVKLSRKLMPVFPIKLEKEFFQTIRIGFSQKRKTLVNGLCAGFHISKQQAKEVVVKAGISESARPQELEINDWVKITLAVLSIKK